MNATDPREAQPQFYPPEVYKHARPFRPAEFGGTPETQLRRTLEDLIDAAGIPLASAPIHWTGRTSGGGSIRYTLQNGTMYHADPTPAPPTVRADLAHITRVSIDSAGRSGGTYVSRRFSA